MTRVLALGAFGVVLGWLVVRTAGVETFDWTVGFLVLGLLCVGLALTMKDERPGALAWVLLAPAGWVALQLVPLPAGLVGWLSPARAAIAAAVAPGEWTRLTNNAWLTSSRLLQMLAFVAAVLAIRELTRRRRRIWLMALPLLLLATLETLLGLGQMALGEGGVIARGSYANRNHFAGLMEMVLPFAFLWVVTSWHQAAGVHRGRKSTTAIVRVLNLSLLGVWMLAAVVFSLSRMGFIATLFGVLVAGVLRWRRRRFTLVVAALVVVGIVFLPTEQLISRFGFLQDKADLSSDDRVQIWKESLDLVKDYPVFGSGLGTYEPTFVKYQRVAPAMTVNFAHNDYLQVLCETGVVGLGLVLGALGFLFWRMLRAMRQAERQEEGQARNLVIACAAAVCAMGLHSVVDFNLYTPANALVFAWICGMAEGVGAQLESAEGLPRPQKRRRRERAKRVAVAV